MILSVSFYYFIMIGLAVFGSVLSIISAVVYMLRRGSLAAVLGYAVDNTINIDHFEEHMPSFPAA